MFLTIQLCNYAKLNCLKKKKKKKFISIKIDLALNNRQGLISHKNFKKYHTKNTINVKNDNITMKMKINKFG